jgi:choice-of-anchor B domain-containing protein
MIHLLLAAPLITWWPAAPAATAFGSAVALYGDELFVARTAASDPRPAADGPRIFVYRRSGGDWEARGEIDPGATPGAGFGSALAAGRDLVAVGAPREGAGSVLVFQRRNGAWSLAARLTPPDTTAGAGFGAALALEEDLLVVAAPGADSARGAVYAFRRDTRTGRWSAPDEVGRGEAPGRLLGVALATAGGRVLAGGPGAQRTGGIAVLYRWGADGAWSEEARLAAPTDSALAFGASVLLGRAEAVVGAPASRRLAGEAFAFRFDGGAWLAAGRIAAGAGDSLAGFGAALARAGRTLAVGAPIADRGQGRIHLFEPADSGWTEIGMLVPPPAHGGSDQRAGARLVARDGLLVASAPTADFGEGAAMVWTRGRDGRWVAARSLADQPASLPPITGRERRCETGNIDAFACREVDVLSFLPLKDIGGRRGIELNDIWGWTDSASGREFALVGRMDGTSFVEVTEPARPRYLGDLPMHAGARANSWRDIKVYKDHAYIVADGAGPHGMQVFDLRQLLTVAEPPATFTETAHYDRIASAHNIVINEEAGYAYPVGANGGGETCGGALHMVDIRNPVQPVFAGCYADVSTGQQRTGYIHDAQCVTYRGPDARYHGREICFNASETAVGISDVTDKANPKPLAVAAYPNTAYAHQGWLTEDQRYFFLDDEGDELAGTVPRTRTLVWDMSKLDEPVLVTEFLGTTAASDHNLYIRGRYMYQSNYVAGLRVIDISDPASPRETGYLDTVPYGENQPGYAGSWSNYPYFRSGTIVVTSGREGLFVVRHRPEELTP